MIQYITPAFLIVVFIAFLIQNLPGHFERMSVDAMISQAIAAGTSVEAARMKALVSRSVFFGILIVFSLIVLLVHYALKYKEKRVNLK